MFATAESTSSADAELHGASWVAPPTVTAIARVASSARHQRRWSGTRGVGMAATLARDLGTTCDEAGRGL